MKKSLSFALNLSNTFLIPKKRIIDKSLGITLVCLTVGLMFSQLLGVTNAEDAPIAKIDGKLLDLIDHHADEYHDKTWDLTLDQYKAWIVTIAWGEGNWGGYTAHSQSGKQLKVGLTPDELLEGDRFDHVVVGDKFRFSTGIGPFQIDRGGYDYTVYGPYGRWGSMPTIEKLDPEIALSEVLYWHYEVKDFGEGTCLNDFQAEARIVWYAVGDAKVAQHWHEVTGTSWDEHKDDKVEDFDWSDVADSIRRDDPEYSFENNVRLLAEVKWDLTFTTDTGRAVSFKSYYPTWKITARHWNGNPLFDYYYTYDASLDCEVWVWDNSGKENEFRYVFTRELNGPFPEKRTHKGYSIDRSGDYYIARAGEYTLDSPALALPVHLPFVPVDLVQVLDRSGSMGSSMGTKTRMQGAKDSAIAVIDTLMSHDRVAVISFASGATTNVQLTGDFDYAKTEIQKISADGMTSFGAGLSLAVNELKDRGSEDHAWAIIFMSDGHHNTAPSPDPYVAECKNLDIPIYTVGLGTYSSDVNEPLLKWMASETGGEYLFAPSLYEMQNIFLRFSLEVTGWIPEAEFSGIVYEGQTVVAGTFTVAPFTAFARVTLNWPGSDLDLILLRPDGTMVDLFWDLDVLYSGASSRPEWVILFVPESGTWTVEVYGKRIDSPDEPFIVWVSKYAPPSPSWDFVFEDAHGRGTTLKIDTELKLFQFITPSKDYGIRNAANMQIGTRILVGRYYLLSGQGNTLIMISHGDSELKLTALALDKLDYCATTAYDPQAKTAYFLMDEVGPDDFTGQESASTLISTLRFRRWNKS